MSSEAIEKHKFDGVVVEAWNNLGGTKKSGFALGFFFMAAKEHFVVMGSVTWLERGRSKKSAIFMTDPLKSFYGGRNHKRNVKEYFARFDSVWSSYPERVKKVTYAYKDCIVPSFTDKSYLEDLANFEVRNDDIFVISYPKSGNTWTQFIVCKILKNYHNMDNQHIFDKVPFIEFPQRHLQMQTENTVPGMYEVAKNLPSPRVLKTHLQSPLLPEDIATKKPKIVYVARNPKDNAVSYYNFSKVSPSLPKYDKWSDFFSDYCQGAAQYGSWYDHVLTWWNRRHEENVMFLKYEDMKKDLRGCVIRIADFLGYYLSSEVIEDIADQSSFSEMKTNPKANPDHLATVKYRNQKGKTFMRKGVVGDWKNYFTVNQNNHFDSLYAKRMEGTNLTFDFTL